MERLVDCGDELCNVASNAAVYWHIYVASNLFIYKIVIFFLYFNFFIKATYQ
jgi:hypothetical protein